MEDPERFYRSGEKGSRFFLGKAPEGISGGRTNARLAKFRRKVGEIIKELCRQKGIELIEGHLMSDHVHICLSVPPKYSIAFVIGFIKGKSAVLIHRKILKVQRVSGLHFWSRGYCVSTVGLDEDTVRKYIREQEKQDKQLEFDFDND